MTAAPPAVTWLADAARSRVVVSVRRLLGPRVTAVIPIRSARLVTAGDAARIVSVEAHLDAAALRTGDAARDAELRGAHYFNTARYPQILFSSDGPVRGSNGELRLEGRLTLHGTTRPIAFRVRILSVRAASGGEREALYAASARFPRSAYGMTYAEGLVSDQVSLSVLLDAVAAAPESQRSPGRGASFRPGLVVLRARARERTQARRRISASALRRR